MATASPPTQTRSLTTAEGFVAGGIAACIAVTFSNPAEMAKTRMQLQGELAKAGGPRVYTSAPDVLVKTFRNEGIRGLQRGLAPAYTYQILLNGCRLGFYEPIRKQVNRTFGLNPNESYILSSVTAGAISGSIGASFGNPFFLIKARMQAYSPVLPVGTQHHYRSSWDALSTIFRTQGPRGLTNGISAAILRTSMGSSVQLPSYLWTKNKLVQNGLGRDDSIWTFLASSAVSGACVCLAMQPADTALTRMYNQPMDRLPSGQLVGTLYKNPIDCLWKTFKAEGLRGWYKGSTAHFLRIAPHTVITLTMNDVIINLYKSTL